MIIDIPNSQSFYSDVGTYQNHVINYTSVQDYHGYISRWFYSTFADKYSRIQEHARLCGPYMMEHDKHLFKVIQVGSIMRWLECPIRVWLSCIEDYINDYRCS